MKPADKWNDNLNNDYKTLSNKLFVYDKWLDRYVNYIKNSKMPIVDLGCGIGNDTLYLKKLGKDVISVDFSDEALKVVKSNIPNAQTLRMDFEKEWLLKKESADLIIANLSLHYFDEKTTFRILNSIKKTLVDNGILIVRVNSIDDDNYGADSMSEIEHHFYNALDLKKRFFDKDDIMYFFRDFDIISCKKELFSTLIHKKGKSVWECVLKNSTRR